MSHGCRNVRRPGSIGNRTSPGRVFKGKRLPGHHGNARITVQNLEVVRVYADRNLILVKGAIPGHSGALVMVRKGVKR